MGKTYKKNNEYSYKLNNAKKANKNKKQKLKFEKENENE